MAERKVSQWAVKEAELRGVDIDLVTADEDGKVGKQSVISYEESLKVIPPDPTEGETKPVEKPVEVEPAIELTPEQTAVQAEADALQCIKDLQAAVVEAKEVYAEACRNTAKYQRPATFAEIIAAGQLQQRKRADGAT